MSALAWILRFISSADVLVSLLGAASAAVSVIAARRKQDVVKVVIEKTQQAANTDKKEGDEHRPDRPGD